ncbi:MAG: amidohydrolase [Lentisphaerae bacterium]|nr:amidohydrolase [Lentisphaerota bacterium]
MEYWIVNGTVFDGINPEPRQVDIKVVDGKIAEIGTYSGGEKIDVAGLQIVPGLVEAHCHLGMAGWGNRYDGADYNEKNDCVTPELNPIDAINPFDETMRFALEGGVTCVGTGPGSSNVLGGSFIAIKTHGSRVDDMVVREKVAMKCAFGENPKNLYQSKFISSRMTTAAKLRETLAKAREYMEKLDAAEKDPNCKKPDFNFKLHAMLPVMRREIPLKAHAHQANDLFTAIRIAKEFNVKLTLEHCTEGHLIADQLAAEGFPLAVGPALTHSGKPEMRKKTYATAGILHRAGCQVSIITDSNVIPQEHLALCAGLAVKAGMDPFAALQAITINPARHLGIEDRVGSIEVGKDADIVVCDGCILESSTKVCMVFVNGEQVV